MKKNQQLSGRGGKREGAGRPKGSLNKATADVKELARQYGPGAIDGLWAISQNSESDAAKVAAFKELLDRAYGKATQIVGGDPDNPVNIRQIITGVPRAGDA